MIWYRHWLDLRSRLLVAVVVAMLIHFAYPLAVHGATSWFRESGKLAPEVLGAQALLAAMGPERLIVWATYVQFSIVSTSLAVMLMGGSTLKMSSPWGATYSVDEFSGSLPVSRSHLEVTRFAAAFAAISAIAFTMCLLNMLEMLALGQPVPWISMLRSTLTAILLVLPLLAAFALIFLHPWALFFISVGPIVAVGWAWPVLRNLLFDPDRSAATSLFTVPLTVALLAATSWFIRRREI